MRRLALSGVCVILIGALGACSDDGDPAADPGVEPTPLAPVTDTTTIDCAAYADTAQQITDAQAALYGDKKADREAAVQTLVDQLDALKAEAPPPVDAALTRLSDGFEAAATVLDDPGGDQTAALAELSPRLAEDSKTITDYIVGECE